MPMKAGRTVLPTPLPGPDRKWSPAMSDSGMAPQDSLVRPTFTRPCPGCKIILHYTQKEGLTRAETIGTRCRKCARRAQIDLTATVKRCTSCGQVKPVDRFVVNSKRPLSGILARCKDCELARFAMIRADLRWRVDALKGGRPCADCGGLFPPVCLDFDHLPQFQKRMGVAEMVSHCRTWVTIEAEIAKCELVCANCHRIRTTERRVAR
jgi:Family of unknown function (DUF6510)